MSKVPCKECGALILPVTAERTGGVCMACKSGIRKNIEASKDYRAREKELEKTCTFRALWRSLHHRIYGEAGGLGALNQTEQKYWALNILEGEVYNGGFDQYFYNSSGSLYLLTVEALMEIGATDALSLLEQAKVVIFGQKSVPEDTVERRQLIRSLWPELPPSLDAIDKAYWEKFSRLGERIERYAVDNGLVEAQPVLQADAAASRGLI